MSYAQPFEHRQYLIVGNGRTAKHFTHYLRALDLTFYQWRRGDSHLNELTQAVDRALLLISDKSIEPFVEANEFLKAKMLIHFSGAMSFDFAFSAHPLNTFGEDLYPIEVYKQTPFIVDSHAPPFEQLLPGFKNPHFKIDQNKKDLYHALCVMSGNFTTLLWQCAFRKFERDLGLPKSALFTYLNQVKENLIANSDTALTGPLTRDDSATIKRNLDALEGTAEQALYKSFLHYYSEVQNEYK